ncbi:MAG: prolyl oligopeptidase family serine peptidase [Candidatus Eisenbacteria bacterium]|nr:prolyl oligopeptidase family serine peptidase [Candidatus Latescibacterota bacterium]MBD3302207.1 prolyl oligopeptidase family serine peptidase [Candidatus Eisenbacteria bacterium]
MFPSRPARSILVAAVLALLGTIVSPPARSGLAYQTPDPVLVDIIDAPKTPRGRIGPNREWMLLRHLPGYPSIEELAEPELRLGGVRFSPRTNGPSRSWSYEKLSLVRIRDRTTVPIEGLPEKPRIENARFSPDGARIAFTQTVRDGIELWVVEIATAKARRLTPSILHLVADEPPRWMPDGRSLIATIVPEGREAPPEAPLVPDGPVTQENLGKEAPARTYQDLLESPHDEALFAHHLTAQLARIDLEGTVERIGPPEMIWSYDPSPDGRYLLVEALHRPFSYIVPAYRFPRRIEIRDLDGAVVQTIADLPLQEEIPIAYGSVATGPRQVRWRADADAQLCWAEALDGGDAGAEAELRDRILLLEAPFADEPAPLIDLPLRFRGVDWGSDDLALVNAYWWKTRTVQSWRVRPGSPGAEPVLLVDRSWEDRYNDPGNPVTERNDRGRPVLLTSPNGEAIYLIGDGASPEGNRPFLDRFDLAERETTRLFRSEAPYYERPLVLLDPEARAILTLRESVTEVPNLFVRDLENETLAPLTSFPHPYPMLVGIEKELIRYERDDGVALSATLYLPPGRSPEEGPFPMLMWAYPREYKDADAAGQIDDSPYRFDRVGWWSPVLWLTQGYAVLDGPTMPIVGEGDAEPNDTFVEQLVASARAAVDEVVRRGVADPDRIAIGGHSYGAFMTANLLAHSDLFAAGLARTGAYNRTLTPFGFQSEERTLWEAPEVYFAMSPFLHADKVNEPILLVHGEADNNPGTFPMQSERFYNALKGHGATTRLVLLPHESHSYRARESILHLVWETQEWLDRYVKEAEKIAP